MQGNRDSEQSEETAIAELLIQFTPEEWSAAQLNVLAANDEHGLTLSHEIVSPEGLRGPVIIPEEIFEHSKRLYDLFSKRGNDHKWISYACVVQYTNDEWSYKIRYRYEQC